jgi:hypothetical protein
MTYTFASRAKVITVINTLLIVMVLPSLGCESWTHDTDKGWVVKSLGSG